MAWQPPSITCANASTSSSYTYATAIPAALRGQDVIMGIDEAGRGPVIGPMVYGIAYYPPSYEGKIRDAGFMDSKVLDHGTRVALTQRLTSSRACDDGNGSDGGEGDELGKMVGWSVRVMSARDISADMLHPTTPVNLNAQAFAATCSLIRGALSSGLRVAHIYVDTLGPPTAHAARLTKEFPMCEFTVAKKADSLYPVVSVASVVAKVTRDYALGVLLKEMHAAAGYNVENGGKAQEGDGGGVEAVVAELEVAEADDEVAAAVAEEVVDDGVLLDGSSRKRRRESDTSPSPSPLPSDPLSQSQSQTTTTALTATRTQGATQSQAAAGWGSGYPSDPNCKSWLLTNKDALFGWPVTKGIRYAWSTARDLLQPPSSSTRTSAGGEKGGNGTIVITWHDEIEADGEGDGDGVKGGKRGRISKYFTNDSQGSTDLGPEEAEEDKRKFDVYKLYGKSLGVEAF